MKPSAPGPLQHRPSAKCTALIPLSLATLFLLLVLLNFTDDVGFGLDHSPGAIRQYLNVSTPTGFYIPGPQPDLRILVGIMTTVTRYEERYTQRLVNSFRPPPPNVQVDVRFVICKVTHDDDRELVALEVMQHGDVMFLDCKENGNSGKTHTFFSAVAREFGGVGTRPTYNYVVKTDDDTYIRYPELVESLMPLPREDLYYGHMVPADYSKKGDPPFMKGMGYALSWDLVDWIERSEFAKNNSMGPEDKLVGLWLQHGDKGKHIYDTKPSAEQVAEWRSGGDRIIDQKATQYDLPWPPLRFMPRTISVHRLKERTQWAQALRYFNVTDGAPTMQ